MLRDLTADTLLARTPVYAASFWSRFAGLMCRRCFPEKYDALIFESCTSIHCFFMFMPIDVLFVDREMRVVKCCHALRPWRLAFGGKGSYSCIELPAGVLKKSGTQPGDQLQLDFSSSGCSGK